MADDRDALIRRRALQITGGWAGRNWGFISWRKYRILAHVLLQLLDENEELRRRLGDAGLNPTQPTDEHQDELELARRSAKCPLA